jgi:hypothetical protein
VQCDKVTKWCLYDSVCACPARNGHPGHRLSSRRLQSSRPSEWWPANFGTGRDPEPLPRA